MCVDVCMSLAKSDVEQYGVGSNMRAKLIRAGRVWCQCMRCAGPGDNTVPVKFFKEQARMMSMSDRREQFQYAFLDSGIGGLPYAHALRVRVPEASLVYVADRVYFPYGNKSSAQIIARASAVLQKVQTNFSPHIVVLACNSMSVNALEFLRAQVSIPVVGVVPAIKQAVACSHKKHIGVLATQCTITHPYTACLRAQFGAGCVFQMRADARLIECLERGLIFEVEDMQREAVARSVMPFQKAGVDALVLACTHFVHVRHLFQDCVGTSCTVVDSLEGVVRRTLRLCPPQSQLRGNAACYVTGARDAGCAARYARYAQHFGLRWAGFLDV
ncbi:glutamate racemase [Treponema paraluiscuniculi]|nr:glutamate racemase [Treponema paraluiscuniculi]